MKPNELTLKQAIAHIQKNELSHDELYRSIHEKIAIDNSTYNIYLSLDNESVLKAQKALHLPLSGMPIAVKDNFLTKGFPTTASSNVLKGFMSPYESTVTSKIIQNGGVIIGKTNMDAWAHGSSTETSDFGPTKNPRNIEYLPGGSSGGSAAAVAANMTTGAIGSETAGSIRQPAAWCGVVGLKPTYGRVSRYGVVSMASSTDSPGPIGKTVTDCALLLNHMAGHDTYDATTSDAAVFDFTKQLSDGVKGMNIGICYIDHPALKNTPASLSVIEAGKVYERLGAHVEYVGMSDTLKEQHILNPDYAIGVYTVVQRGEVSSNLGRYDSVRFGAGREYFGSEAKRRIMLGTFTLSEGYADKYYLRAQKVRSLIIENFRQLFRTYDVLIAPTSAGYAQKLGASYDNPLFGELEDMLLEASSVAGLTGISVPCMRDPKTHLFLGLDIMGDQWQEEKVLKAAYAYEQATDWNEWAKNERD